MNESITRRIADIPACRASGEWVAINGMHVIKVMVATAAAMSFRGSVLSKSGSPDSRSLNLFDVRTG